MTHASAKVGTSIAEKDHAAASKARQETQNDFHLLASGLFGAVVERKPREGVSVPKFHSISPLALLEPPEFIGELVDDRSESVIVS